MSILSMPKIIPGQWTFVPPVVKCSECTGRGLIWKESSEECDGVEGGFFERTKCLPCTGTGRHPCPFEEVWGIVDGD